MKNALKFTISLICLLVCTPGLLHADVSVAEIFSDHMVIQQEKPVTVWGWAAPGEQVTVRLGRVQKSSPADASGRWTVVLPAMSASASSKTMTVSGHNTLTIQDILVGEVWLCSGQSNMEWNLGGAETGAQEVPRADHPTIRLFKINAPPNPYPQSHVQASWRVCRPDSVGDFTAVGYFFGKHLNEQLDVPVGLIQAAWGGTRIEPWTSRKGFEQQPALADVVARIDKAEASYRGQMPGKLQEIQTWIKQTQQALAENAPALPSVNWPRHPIYSEGHPTEPTCLYNTRIFPIVPFAMRGAIWYQGESNMGEAMLYYEKTKALVSSWRTAWQDSTLSFYAVQLAPFRHYGPDDLPRIWEAQVEGLKIPRTGLAVINDIGNLEDIHPRNKRDVGKRLALCALAKDYGRSNVVYSGPMFKAMTVKGQVATIAFDHVHKGLATRNDAAPDWFEIAGADKVFYPAQATIVGNQVQVSCDKVTAPVAVRFAWDNTAEPNLMNKNGLPASTFRTDRW